MATVLDAAKALAASTGARAASTATEAMADPAVNAIMIATSSDTHVELLYEAVKTGTPVLCEKPLASSYDASREYAWLRAGPDIDRFMAAAEPNVRLLLDTGPCIFGGTDPAAMAERYMGRIGHIPCKNIRRPVIEQVRAEELSFLEDVQRGGRRARRSRWLRGLRAGAEDRGWLVIEAEQDSLLRDPFRYQDMRLWALKVRARQAGLDRVGAWGGGGSFWGQGRCPPSLRDICAKMKAQSGKETGMSRLLCKPSSGHGELHRLTLVEAGWRYVGFSLWRLLDQRCRPGPGCNGRAHGRLREEPAALLYLPDGSDWRAEAASD